MGRFISNRQLIAAAGLLLMAVAAISLVRWFRAADGVGPEELWLGSGAWAHERLRDLTPEQKVAQLFSAAAWDRSGLTDLVERFEAGGIVVGGGRPSVPGGLVEFLQRRAGVPLLVTHDLIGGAADEGFPPPMAIAATGDLDLAYSAGYAEAQRARKREIRHMAAPPADAVSAADSGLVRVQFFGGRPDAVGDMLTAYIRGMMSAGVMPALAYVPGRGEETGWLSSLPIFSRSGADAQLPLRTAIREGLMSVIVGAPGNEPEEADTLAERAVRLDLIVRELRDELGFNGLIAADIEDFREAYPELETPEAAVKLIDAGADMLFVSEEAYEARTAILEAINSGRLSQQRIDESVLRILRAKEWLGLARAKGEFRTVDLSVPSAPADIIDEVVANASLTLLRNEGDLLPILDQRPIRIVPVGQASVAAVDTFVEYVGRYAGDSLVTVSGPNVSGKGETDDAAEPAGGDAITVVPIFTGGANDADAPILSEEDAALVDSLVTTEGPVVVVSFGSPYVIREIADPAVYIVGYSGGAAVQRAVARTLFGRAGFAGRLPVSIADHYEAGEGIQVDQVMIRDGLPEEVGMDSGTLAQIDSLMETAIRQRAFPGAAVAVGREGVLTKLQGYGTYTYGRSRPVTPQSVFDMASLTKVIATTTAAMKLHEQGRLNIMAPVGQFFPAFREGRKRSVTVWNLLTHSAGLVPFRPYHTMGLRTRQEVIDAILAEDLVYEPGTKTVYSDHGLILLSLIVEQVTGQDFARWTKENIFEPLGMHRTGFRPVGMGSDPAIVPTEVDKIFRNRLVQGEVHDETAYLLGGVSGHAGLFSTAEDLSKFAFMLINGGRANGQQFLRPETIALFTARAEIGDGTTRALGWDTKSPEGYTSAGQLFGPRSYGHTGFTGTSLWIDPDAGLFAVLLTNRVYPTRDNHGIRDVRSAFADLAHRAIIGPPAPVLPGRAAQGTAVRRER